MLHIWNASSEFGTYRLCEQRRFRRACASAQSRQNLRCSLIQAVSQEEPSDMKPDPWPLWMAGHAQLKFVMTECSKTQIGLTGLIWANMSDKSCDNLTLSSSCSDAIFPLVSVFTKSCCVSWYKYVNLTLSWPARDDLWLYFLNLSRWLSCSPDFLVNRITHNLQSLNYSAEIHLFQDYILSL